MWIKRSVKASAVVEMTYMMGIIMLMWIAILYAFFYYYDKVILSGAAYETVVVGSEIAHEEGAVEPAYLEQLFQKRIRGKLIFMPYAETEVQVEKDGISLKIRAKGKGMKLLVERTMAVTTPERKIRAIRTAKEMIEELY